MPYGQINVHKSRKNTFIVQALTTQNQRNEFVCTTNDLDMQLAHAERSKRKHCSYTSSSLVVITCFYVFYCYICSDTTHYI